MTKDEALKLALDALLDIPFDARNPMQKEAITAIKEALAPPAQEPVGAWRLREVYFDAHGEPLMHKEPAQEPVAWMHRMDNTEGIKANGKGIVSITQKRKHPFGKPGVDFSKSYPVTSTPLYTTPPQRPWVGLTDEETQWLYDNCRTPSNLIDMVEAKLKEKNT
jgi:hypothetical protein